MRRFCDFVEEFDMMFCHGYATEVTVPLRLEYG